jgi:hypothetical protein
MKRGLIGIAMLLLSSLPALAQSCTEDLAAIDQALGTTDIDPEQKAQAEDMRKQAQDLCAAGNEEEAMDVIAETKALLDME